MGSRSRRWIQIFGWTATLLALLAVLEYLKPPRPKLGWDVAFDVGHAPLFGLVSLVILQLIDLLRHRLAERRLRSYALALALTVLLGVLDEAQQILGARDSNPMDLLRDAIGATSFLIFAASFDRDVLRGFSPSNRSLALVRGGAVALLVVAFFPAFTAVRAYALRADAFPRLCDFEAGWETHFISVRGAELTLIPPPARYDRDSNNRVGRISFHSPPNPYFSLEEPYPDWTGYQTLRFEVFSELDRTVTLDLQILDDTSENRDGDRFARELSIRPGVNQISVALAEVRSAPEGREMNMSSIRYLILYARDSKRPFSLLLDAFRLENR